MAAADVGDARAGTKLCLRALKRWNPVLHEMCGIAVAEYPVGKPVEPRVVLFPADTLAGLERFSDFRLIGE